jgi:hypothetical protein
MIANEVGVITAAGECEYEQSGMSATRAAQCHTSNACFRASMQ